MSKNLVEILYHNHSKVNLPLRQKRHRGQLVMLKFATILEEFGTPENVPKLETSKWLMILKPKKKN